MIGGAHLTRFVERLLAPIQRRVRMMVLRGIVTLIDDAQGVQIVQVESLADRTSDDVEHLQPFGLTAHPPADSEGVLLAVGGSADHPVLLNAASRADRPTGLAEGETKIYGSHGATLYLNDDGEVVFEDATGSTKTMKSDGTIAIVPSGASVELGADPASGPVALSTPTDSRFATIEAILLAFAAHYNVHIHNGTVLFTVNPFGSTDVTGPPTTAPYTPVPVPTSTAATKVNAT